MVGYSADELKALLGKGDMGVKKSYYEGESVPAVLLSGDHEAVKRWRENEAKELTKIRRPDLIQG